MSKRKRTSFRVPHDVAERIDRLREALPGIVSRNDWILVAVAEKLARDEKVAK